MGSLFKPKVPDTPSAPPQPDYDTQDLINKVQSKIVTGPDGKKTVITSRMDLTPEEQALEDRYKKLTEDSLSRYEALSKTDWMNQVPEAKQAMDAFYNYNRNAIDNSFRASTGAQESQLARYGVENSTAATELRSANQANYQDALANLDSQKYQLGEGIRQQEQNNALQLYGIGQARGDATYARLADALKTNMSFGQGIAQLGQNRNLAVYQGDLQNNALRAQASSQGMNTFGQLAGLAVGGGFGGFGSSFAGLGAKSISSGPAPTNFGGATSLGGYSNFKNGRVNWY